MRRWIFVDAIAAVRGGADAVHCHRQGDRCCKDKNQTILGESLGRQGGRRALHDGYAPVSSLSSAGATLMHGHARVALRAESPAGAIDTGMKTFHEWLSERMKNEGLWLNDKNAVIGLSRLNPLRIRRSTRAWRRAEDTFILGYIQQ